MLFLWALQACTVRPCASTWLGAGRAYLSLRDLQQADLCLMEANLLNNQVRPSLSSPSMQPRTCQPLKDVVYMAAEC